MPWIALPVWWTFYIYIPVSTLQLLTPPVQLIGLHQPGPLVVELQFALTYQPSQPDDVALTKGSAKFNNIDQVGLAVVGVRVLGGFPRVAFERRTAAGYQGMDMRMMIEFLVSGV